MRHVATDVTRSVVCIPVSVCWSYWWAVRKRMNRGWLMMGTSNHALDWVDIPFTGKGQFWGLHGPLKTIWESLLWCMRKSIIQTSITEWQRHCCSRLQCSRLFSITLLVAQSRSSGAHCVTVVDKAITMDNLRLLYQVVNVCRGTARRPRYKFLADL